jgi:hypothetical protein
MSARLLRSLTDENQDLQKQIGCMNGIFQLFDRHHFLNGRRTNSHSRKRLPPGIPLRCCLFLGMCGLRFV